jgi:hypothetical protein
MSAYSTRHPLSGVAGSIQSFPQIRCPSVVLSVTFRFEGSDAVMVDYQDYH